MTKQTKVLIAVGAGLGALLIAVIIIGIVIIGQLNAAKDQAEHSRIVAICEDGLADPYGSDLDKMTACMTDLEERR